MAEGFGGVSIGLERFDKCFRRKEEAEDVRKAL